MTNPKDNFEVDWNSLEEFLNRSYKKESGEEPREINPLDQSHEFHQVMEPILDKIYNYCKSHKIPFVASFAVLKSFLEENEQGKEEEEIGTKGRSLFFVPTDTEHSVCTLMACALILQMPHEFSHFVMSAAQSWAMMGAATRGFTMEGNDSLDDTDEEDGEENE